MYQIFIFNYILQNNINVINREQFQHRQIEIERKIKLFKKNNMMSYRRKIKGLSLNLNNI